MIRPPVWVAELAERFWSAAGPPPPVPRDLTAPTAFALTASLFHRPNLTVATVLAELRGLGVPLLAVGSDRPLRAALYCWKGLGFLFVDSTDPADEQRFSLAHEIAHFLRDSDAVRRRVMRALGPAAVEVLDGRRPTAAEQIRALLRNVPLVPHVHLMNRDNRGRPAGEPEQDAEDRADQLAFELLAPFDELPSETHPDALAERLVSAFGLPPGPARRYAAWVLPPDE